MKTTHARRPTGPLACLAVSTAILLGWVDALPSAAPAAEQPDYSKLTLKGSGMSQDSFSLALRAAAKLLGREADYETTCALSTNAFSPRVNPNEDCMAWWHVDARIGGDVGIQTAAARIGLKATLLRQPAFRGDWQKAPDRLAHFRAVAKIVREAMARGQVVLAMGGWQAKQQGRFVPRGWAGIIVEARADGTILGACLNGRKDNRMESPPNCWLLSACEPSLTPLAADVKMLTDAVARIRASRRPFLRLREGPAFGLDAMDLWIRRMSQVPFCEPCFKSAPKRVWTCAHDNGNTTRAMSNVAASYLRKRKRSFPAKAQPHLEAAAKQYDRIAKLLAPAVTGKGGEHYRTFIGDLDKQKAHVENVLKPIKAALAAAAAEMGQALKAAGPGV